MDKFDGEDIEALDAMIDRYGYAGVLHQIAAMAREASEIHSSTRSSCFRPSLAEVERNLSNAIESITEDYEADFCDVQEI